MTKTLHIRTLDDEILLAEIDQGNYPNAELMTEMRRRYLYQKDRVRTLSKMLWKKQAEDRK